MSRRTAYSAALGSLFVEEAVHTCWEPSPNYYKVYDIGRKLIRHPDGTRHRVATRKVVDTAGTSFYVFDADTPFTPSHLA